MGTRAATPRKGRRRASLQRLDGKLALLVIAGIVIAGGFLVSAWLHFAATNVGYRREQLLEYETKLEGEKMRLSLEKARSHSPDRVGAAAKEDGLLKPEWQELSIAPGGAVPIKPAGKGNDGEKNREGATP